MSKFKRGDVVIYLDSVLAEDRVIAEIEPKRWWHVQQRYLVESALPGSYYRYKEKHLMLKSEDKTNGK